MKKTNRNQNMPDQRIRNNDSANTASLSNLPGSEQKETYSNANLDQPITRNSKQRYDDTTGTVENKLDNL